MNVITLPIRSLSIPGSQQYLDISRIEVMRGPQNVLYGRASQGGAVNIVTAEPDGTRDIRMRGEIGTDGPGSPNGGRPKFVAALRKARNCMAAMSQLMRDAPWFVGEQLTLADLYAAPMFDYFLVTSEGAELIRQHANLQEWWERMASRPSMAATKPS